MRISAVILSVFVLLGVQIVPFSQPYLTAYAEDYTQPGKVNKIFGNFTTPVIVPGKSGILNFTIRNYYATPVYNITLIAEIYFYATIETSAVVDANFVNAPHFRTSNAQNMRIEWSEWRVFANQPYNQYRADIGIDTYQSTPEGTYFIRFTLTFYDPNGGYHILKSRGCFTNQEWKDATTNVSDYDMSMHGGVNITMLGVDGILPDTSFTVSAGVNLIPFFILIALAVLSGALTVMYYLNETKGMFPWLEHITYRWKGKFYQFWTLFKKRFKKK